MDISRLLSPCSDYLPPFDLHEADSSETSFLATIRHSSQTSPAILGLHTGARPQTKGSRPRRALPMLLPVKRDKTLVKRKRKRRLSAKQLQVMHENQHDESQLYNLTLDINDLKQEVQDYTVHKRIHATRALVNRQNFTAGVLRITNHFFQILRTGFRQWEQQEAAFLGVTLDQDVAVGTIGQGSVVTGSSQFFEQWRRYSKLLRTRSVTHSSIHILVSDNESCVVECKGEFEGILTLAAIEAVFPHILNDMELLSKVVNRRFVCPRKTLVYFDERGRIVQYEANVDFFAGLNRILASNPMDLITLMSNARISTEGSLIPDADDGVRVEMIDVDCEALDATEEKFVFAPDSPTDPSAASDFASVSSSNEGYSSRSSLQYILS